MNNISVEEEFEELTVFISKYSSVFKWEKIKTKSSTMKSRKNMENLSEINSIYNEKYYGRENYRKNWNNFCDWFVHIHAN